MRLMLLANKRLKLSSSRGGGIQIRQASEANRGVEMFLNSKLRARSLSADRYADTYHRAASQL